MEMVFIDLTRCGQMRKVLYLQHYDLVESMLNACMSDKEKHDDYLQTVIEYQKATASEKEFDKLSVILAGFQIYTKARYIDALLYRSVLDEDISEVHDAIAEGANVNAWCGSSLRYAIRYGHSDIVAYLRGRGAVVECATAPNNASLEIVNCRSCSYYNRNA